MVYPLRVTYIFDQETPHGIQAGFSASKKLFRKAVDRNHAKRRLREAYRLQKQELVAHVTCLGIRCLVFFIYTGKEKAQYKEVYASMSKALLLLKNKIRVDGKPV